MANTPKVSIVRLCASREGQAWIVFARKDPDQEVFKGDLTVPRHYMITTPKRMARALQVVLSLPNNEVMDVHTETAAKIYGVSPDEVTPKQRRQGKVVDFGMLYGMAHAIGESDEQQEGMDAPN